MIQIVKNVTHTHSQKMTQEIFHVNFLRAWITIDEDCAKKCFTILQEKGIQLQLNEKQNRLIFKKGLKVLLEYPFEQHYPVNLLKISESF